ncbi:hypothetical protein ACFYZ9_35830 [Streptomyces sp. NPDC001691]|uniref:hypothetical protein n=1 Tax=Streptomyces sp. NPDC001691 TaxID=3364600 RepID=UPI0036BE5263
MCDLPGVPVRGAAKLGAGIVGVWAAVAVRPVGWAAAAGEEPCGINTDTAVIREQPSKAAAKAGIGYRAPQCRFHGYTREAAWAHVTMQGCGMGGSVSRDLISPAKEQLARTGR